MCQKNCNKKRKKGQHLNLKERNIIEHLYNEQNKNFTEIGKEIGCHRTTISREIDKGLIVLEHYNYGKREIYSAEKGQKIYDNNATAKGPQLKIEKNFKLASFIEEKIKKEKKSPYDISQSIKKSEEFEVEISPKTIYNYIEKGVLLVEKEDLVIGNYKKSKEKPKEKPRTKKFKEGKTIHDRPKEVDEREELGHWEMDLVEGKKGEGDPYLLVLSERVSRKEIIELISNKEAKSVQRGLDRIERRHGVVKFREQFKTITTDNGSEFKNYELIERSFTGSNISRTTQYFCDAFCSYQRGTNENINKMIRRFLPKGTSFKNLTRNRVKEIQKYINEYSRKILNGKTALEFYEDKLKAA